MFLIAALLFAAAEIASFVLVALQIGFFWALAILILVSALGLVVVWRVGAGVLADTRQRLARGEVPTRELLDGLVVLIGGLMICVPGFVGDTIGLLLMIAPVRHLVIRVGGHGLARRVQTVRLGGQVVDTSSRMTGDDGPSGRRPPDLLVGPGDPARRPDGR